jgi:hypothetical protein
MGALAAGSGLPLHQTPCDLADGGMVTYGCLRGLRPLFDRVRAEKRNFVYVDNGYFRPSAHSRKDYSGYYRATHNALQHNGAGGADPHRFEMLGKRLHAWRSGGSEIMICPPSVDYGEWYGFDAVAWLGNTLATLKKHTDRPIRIREKRVAGGCTLWDALRTCHALVTHSSNAAVEALLFGVPVFCTEPCAAYAMGDPNIVNIECPRRFDREQWAWNLAANQWTLAEMKSGAAWREVMQ